MRTTNEIREKIVKMYLEGYSVARIMSEIGIKSNRTIYKVLDAAGVIGTERQERDADVLNITLTDAAVVQWLRSQPNAAEAITKLVYSQIEGGPEKSKIQEQNSRIADSTVEQKTKKICSLVFRRRKRDFGQRNRRSPLSRYKQYAFRHCTRH